MTMMALSSFVCTCVVVHHQWRVAENSPGQHNDDKMAVIVVIHLCVCGCGAVPIVVVVVAIVVGKDYVILYISLL
jgi:hypothetical protein